jgi:hypothetical protein
VLIVNPIDFEASSIAAWKAGVDYGGATTPKYDFIPSALMPAWISNEEIHGTVIHPRPSRHSAGRRIRSNSTVNRPVTRAPSSHGGLVRSHRTSMAGHRPKAASICLARHALTRRAMNTAWADRGSTVGHATKPRATAVTKLLPETWSGRGLPAPGAPALAARRTVSAPELPVRCADGYGRARPRYVRR